jgi:hypothetical protein
MTCGAQIDFRVRVKLRDLHFEVGGMPDIIVIEKGYYLAARVLHSPVAGRGSAALPDLDHSDSRLPRTKPCRSVVRGAIVYHYDLETAVTLRVDAVKCAR